MPSENKRPSAHSFPSDGAGELMRLQQDTGVEYPNPIEQMVSLRRERVLSAFIQAISENSSALESPPTE